MKLKTSSFFQKNTSVDFNGLFHKTLNINEYDNLGIYLGLPISHKRDSRAQVQFVVHRVGDRLSNWKSHYLSKAVRLCLISSTFNDSCILYTSIHASYVHSQGARLDL